jgi:predicted phosphate transport protein (TIGR00153 family)
MASLAHLFASRDRVFYELFATLAGTAVKAAEELVELLEHFPENIEARTAALRAMEHDGDEQLHIIRDRLNHTFVTPIDREDILELGSALDDVIDLTEETSDYLLLYGIEAPMEQAQRLARILLDATRQIELAVPSIRDFSDVSKFTHEIHRLENEGDRTSRDAIASLFREGIDPMVVIRWKDIFERLEQAIDATERVADVIDEIIIKNA